MAPWNFEWGESELIFFSGMREVTTATGWAVSLRRTRKSCRIVSTEGNVWQRREWEKALTMIRGGLNIVGASGSGRVRRVVKGLGWQEADI